MHRLGFIAIIVDDDDDEETTCVRGTKKLKRAKQKTNGKRVASFISDFTVKLSLFGLNIFFHFILRLLQEA